MENEPPKQETSLFGTPENPPEPSKMWFILALIRRWGFRSIILIIGILAIWGLMYRCKPTYYVIHNTRKLAPW